MPLDMEVDLGPCRIVTFIFYALYKYTYLLTLC